LIFFSKRTYFNNIAFDDIENEDKIDTLREEQEVLDTDVLIVGKKYLCILQN